MTKKRISRIIVSLSLIAVLVFSSATVVFGCTAVYFGKETTENGSILAGRSEDSSWTTYKKFYTVREAETHEDGAMYVGYRFTMPYPAKTLAYTMVKDYTGEGEEEMAQVGVNEKGVAVSGTNTLSGILPAVSAVDPMVSNGGIREDDIPSVVLMQAETARDGAQLLIDIYETYGAGGREMTLIQDKNEAWHVQALSGHNAVAVKAPDDMVGFSPNITGNVDITDKKNTIITKNLLKTAEEAGTLKRDARGQMLVADSYASKPGSVSTRIRQGYTYLRDEGFAAAQTADYIDFYLNPRKGKKYSLYEALRILAYRGENTEYYGGTGTGNGNGIGNDNNLETHIFESRENMPMELGVIQWLSLTPPEFGVYIPGYNAIINATIPENGNSENLLTMTYDNTDKTKNSYRTVFYELYFLCKGRDNTDGLTVSSLEARTKYGKGVQDFWEIYQKEIIAKQDEIDKEMLKILAYDKDLAIEKATALNMHLQREALGYAQQMVDELKAYMADPEKAESFIPTALTEGKLPTYSFDAIDGTGLEVALELDLGDGTAIDLNGGIGEKIGTLPSPTKENYDFDGWFEDNTYTTPITEDTIITEGMTIVAKWSNKEVALKLDLGDGKTMDLDVTANNKIGALPVPPEKDDYKFGGWFEDNTYTTPITADTIVTEGMTIVAQWISKTDIKGAVVTGIKAKIYNGKAQTQGITVKNDGKVLTAGTDYTVAYSNNKAVGKATVTIIGKGDYKSQKDMTFKINPKSTKITKTKVGKKKATVKWKKVAGTTKYQVQYKVKGKKAWKTKTVSAKKTSLAIKTLKKGKKYQVKVRSYRTVKGVKYYSAWSKVKTTKKIK